MRHILLSACCLAFGLAGCADLSPSPTIADSAAVMPRLTVLTADLPADWRVERMHVARDGWITTVGSDGGDRPDGFRAGFYRNRQLTMAGGVQRPDSGEAIRDALYLPRAKRVVYATRTGIGQWDPAEGGVPGRQDWPSARLGIEAADPALAPLGGREVLLRAGSLRYRFDARSGRAEAVRLPEGAAEIVNAGSGRWLVARSAGPLHEPGIYLFIEATGETRAIASGAQFRGLQLRGDGQVIFAQRLGEDLGASGFAVHLTWRGTVSLRINPPAGDGVWRVLGFSAEGRFVAWQQAAEPGRMVVAVADMAGRVIFQSPHADVVAGGWAPESPTLYLASRRGRRDVLMVVQLERP